MAYHADDTFLPSWGSGMRPREPIEHDEFSSGFDDYPPKPKMKGTPMGSEMDQLNNPYATETLMHHAAEYGTINDPVDEKDQKVHSTPQLRRLERVQVAQKSMFLLFWPVFLGLLIVAAFGLRYWKHRLLAHAVLFFVIAFAFTLIVIGARGGIPGKASVTFFMVNGCCIFSVAMVSLCLGMFCFQAYTKTYEIYRGSQHYEGIAPHMNPGAHRDGGVIQFIEGSHVDATKSIGFRNGDFYCAAPILSPESSSYSGFWAVGTNCCGARASFRCGGADKQVRSGLVVLDENFFGAAEIPEYLKAAEEASAQFEIGMPSMPIFVRVSKDVDAERDQYYHDGLQFVFAATTGLFVFMLVIVNTLSSMSSDQQLAANYYAVEVYDMGGSELHRKMWVKKKKAHRRPERGHDVDPFNNL